MVDNIKIPEKSVPIIYNADLCVIGGSCTGLFAAIRAARMELRVVIVEKMNCFGGTATAGLVNVWHSLYDTDYNEQIIGGLTYETEKQLENLGALNIENNDSVGCRFNSAHLAVLLDKMAVENKIKVYFHTVYTGYIADDGKISAITVANKDGISAISARFFIDATGDGDLAKEVGLNCYRNKVIQPPSSCFLIQGLTCGIDIGKLVKEHGDEFGLDDDWGWSGSVPNLDQVSFRADNHIFGVDCSKADDLSKAEIEGRKKTFAFVRLLQKYASDKYELISLCSSIGIRDTLHFETQYRANEDDLLLGKKYDNIIAKGTYRVDIHHPNDNGITFKYLDGRQTTYYGKGTKEAITDWRKEKNITTPAAKYYSVPWELLVQNKVDNLIAVGRMLNADEGAFGALRVMVNLNQLGEAAGVGAALCLQSDCKITEIDGKKVHNELKKGGSAV